MMMISAYIDFGDDLETEDNTEGSLERWNKALKYIKYSLNHQLPTLFLQTIDHQCEARRREKITGLQNVGFLRHGAAQARTLEGRNTDTFLDYRVLLHSLDILMEYLLPTGIGPTTREYLVTECTKPEGMTVRQYYRHIRNLQNDMNCLPGSTPGWGAISKTEMKKTILRGCPGHWLGLIPFTEEHVFADEFVVLRLVEQLTIIETQEADSYTNCLENLISNKVRAEVSKRRIAMAIEQGVNDILHPQSAPNDYPRTQFRADTIDFGTKQLIDLLQSSMQLDV